MSVVQIKNNSKPKQARCVVCRKEDNAYLYTVNTFPVVKCLSCGFVFSRRYLEPVDFSEIYSQNYFHGDDYVDYLADEKIIKENFGSFLKSIKRYQPAGRLLEVGSAYGFFLDVAKDDYECTGQEISRDAADYARRNDLNVLNGDLISLGLERNSFDLAVMWDTIEHLQRPDLYLAEIHRVLKNHGYLFFTTGNIDAIVPKIKGRQWRLMKPPWHLHYFSKKTATRLLNRLDFEVIDIRTAGFSRSFEMILTKLSEKNRFWKNLTAAFLNTFHLKSKSIYLNLFDIMFVVAQKKVNREQR